MTSLLVESLARSLRLKLPTASQLPSQGAWLSPANLSTNHNILRKAQGKIFIKWKSTGFGSMENVCFCHHFSGEHLVECVVFSLLLMVEVHVVQTMIGWSQKWLRCLVG
jgi:hypothetical protein